MPTFPEEYVEQAGFQVFNDDGGPANPNNATARGGANASVNIPLATKFRMRLRVLNLYGPGGSFRFLLEYRKNGGSWAAVTGATEVKIVTSANFADNDPTTQRVGTGSFVAGSAIESVKSADAIVFPPGALNTYTEVEWSLQADSPIVLGDVLQFRVVTVASAWSGGAYTGQTLGAYNVYGNVTIGSQAACANARAMVFEGTQIGMEATCGVAVAATRKLLCTALRLSKRTRRRTYRPQGAKVPTSTRTGREDSALNMDGTLCFPDALYQFSNFLIAPTFTTPATNGTFTVTPPGSGNFTLTYNGVASGNIAFNATTATVKAALEAVSTIGVGNVDVFGATGGPWTVRFINALERTDKLLTASAGTVATTAASATRRVKFYPSLGNSDAIQYFTVENGSLVGAAQAAFGFLSSLTIGEIVAEGEEIPVSGTGHAQRQVDPFSITTTGVVDVPAVPADPKNVRAWIGATPLSMQLLPWTKLALEFPERQHPYYAADVAEGFSKRVENGSEPMAKFTIEHASLSQALLSALRTNTRQYMQVEFLGPQIEAGYTYRLAMRFPVDLLTPEDSEDQDVHTMDWGASLVYDTTFGGWLQVDLDTIQTAL